MGRLLEGVCMKKILFLIILTNFSSVFGSERVALKYLDANFASYAGKIITIEGMVPAPTFTNSHRRADIWFQDYKNVNIIFEQGTPAYKKLVDMNLADYNNIIEVTGVVKKYSNSANGYMAVSSIRGVGEILSTSKGASVGEVDVSQLKADIRSHVNKFIAIKGKAIAPEFKSEQGIASITLMHSYIKVLISDTTPLYKQLVNMKIIDGDSIKVTGLVKKYGKSGDNIYIIAKDIVKEKEATVLPSSGIGGNYWWIIIGLFVLSVLVKAVAKASNVNASNKNDGSNNSSDDKSSEEVTRPKDIKIEDQGTSKEPPRKSWIIRIGGGFIIMMVLLVLFGFIAMWLKK